MADSRELWQQRYSGLTPEPGWYLDPSDNSLLRYWDGTAWTEYKKPAASSQTFPVNPTPTVYHKEQPVRQKPRRHRRSNIVYGTILTVSAAACVAAIALIPTISKPGNDATGQSYVSTSPTESSKDLASSAVRESQEYAHDLKIYVEHIYDWWQKNMPKVNGQEFGSLEGGIIPATLGSDLPACTGGEFPQNNAYYTSCADVIVYDDVQLFPSLYETHGSLALGIVLAHEFGHAAQARTDYYGSLSSHTTEVQADCYAGAWLADFKRDATDAGVDANGAEVIALGLIVSELGHWDVGFDDGSAAGSHGSGFDRVASFTDGLSLGIEHCSGYAKSPPSPVMPQWSSVEDYYAGGDLTGTDLFEALIRSTEEYWPYLPGGESLKNLPETMYDSGPEIGCPRPEGTYIFGWCEKAGSVVTYEEGWGTVQDFHYGAALGLAWADAYKRVSGNTFHRACLVGSWIRHLQEGVVLDLSLSPGDVDEALAVMVVADSAPAGNGDYEFRHVKEFKNGYLGGCS